MAVVLQNFGFLSFGVTDYVSKIHTLHYGAVVAKQPRLDTDKKACHRLGLRLAEWISVFVDNKKHLHPLLTTKKKDQMEKKEAKEKAKDPATEAEATESDPSSKTSKKEEVVERGEKKKVLVFTKATDYVHTSLPAAASWLARELEALGYEAVVTDDGRLLESDGPSQIDFAAIVMVNNSGELFDLKKETLSKHIEQGRGVMGVHATLASFLDGEDAVGATKLKATTSIIQETFGAHFLNHPPPQEATVVVDEEQAKALGLEKLPLRFQHVDEFFNYNRNPIDAGVSVVASVDESTYKGGLMGKSHPVVWHHTLGPRKAKVFYCALGHFSHFYNGLGSPHVGTLLKAGLRHILSNNYPSA
uniref:ThuA-like domain-containing protein n=1 Tax=Lotharella oceanica TaxID=641309 RepID=A0A7S2XEJ5_9EUKA